MRESDDAPGLSINWKRVGLVVGVFFGYLFLTKLFELARDMQRDPPALPHDAEIERNPLAYLGRQVAGLAKRMGHDITRIDADAADLEQRVTALERERHTKHDKPDGGGTDATA